MITQARTSELSTADHRSLGWLLDRVTGFGVLARRTSSRHHDTAAVADCTVAPAFDVPVAIWANRCCRPDAPKSFVVVGTSEDRKAFTIAIRAFALAGRRGDCLTLVGCGPHRRRLEKWSVALRIEHDVHFAEPGYWDPAGVADHDIAVIVSRNADQVAVLLRALLTGCGVLATNENTAAATLLDDGRLGRLFPPRDVTALTHAMLVVSQPDPAIVLQRLNPCVVPDLSPAPAIDPLSPNDVLQKQGQ